MRLLYPAASIFSLLVVQGAAANESSLWSGDWLFGRPAETADQEQLAQAKAKTPAKPHQPPQGAAGAAQQGSQSPPTQQESQGSATQQELQSPPAQTTETTNFDNWIVSCREFVEGPKKRTCAMTVAVRKTDTNRTVLSWTVRQNDKGEFVSIVETLPGISIPPGIQLKLEKSSATRTIPIEVCEPTWCSGTLAMDQPFTQEASASSKVTIVVTSSAGQPLTFEFPIRGFDKAYAKM